MRYYSCVLVAVVADVPIDKRVNAIEGEQGKEVDVILDGRRAGENRFGQVSQSAGLW